MKWVKQIVDEILEKYPNEEIYTCACGLSTTGLAHAGNFREIIITHFVVRELKTRGKNVRFILSFDDFDRLKKVTFGTDKSFEQYIGMANYDIPSPKKEGMKYAEWYEKLVEKELHELNIFPEFIRQSDNYVKHKYDDIIKTAIKNKNDIFKIISKYKTQTSTAEDENKYFPARIYCSECRKDFTEIEKYDPDSDTITFNCKCGAKKKEKLSEAAIKLNFKIDWPMRWNYEKINFEPCGKGHSGPKGALAVSREISKYLFNDLGPVIITYEFLKTKNNDRMNKNSKDIITISNLLDIMPVDMILWLYLIKEPSKEMNLSLDEKIIEVYKKYEKFLNSNDLDSLEIKKFLNISDNNLIPFSVLIKYLPICNFDINLLPKYLQINLNDSRQLKLIKYAITYLNKYHKRKYWVFNSKPNELYWKNMSEEEKKDISDFKTIIGEKEFLSGYLEFICNIKSNNRIKSFYKNLYYLLFNTENGIPIKTIIENYDLSQLYQLLEFEDNVNIRQTICEQKKCFKRRNLK